MKLSIVIPCYNEAKNLPLLLGEYAKCIARDDVEVVLVNNGSKDDSAAVLEGLKGSYPFLKVVTVAVNQGYGFGILSGLRSATGEYVGWAHGDLQTPPKDTLKALDIIASHPNRKDIYIKGKREGRPFFDMVFTWGMNVFESLYMGVLLVDINGQPNVFHRSFFESWDNPPIDFAIDLYAFYKARKQGFEIVRFDVPFLKRIHGVSSWNTGIMSKWKLIKRTIGFSKNLKKSLS